METVADRLRQIAKGYNNFSTEKRIQVLYNEVCAFASHHACMGHFGVRFDVFWDNNEETRKVCKMLADASVLSAVTNCDDEAITESVIRDGLSKDHWLQPNNGIQSLYLDWA